MYRIDKSTMNYADSYKSSVVIKRWVKQENAPEENRLVPPQPEEHEKESAPPAFMATNMAADLELLARKHAAEIIDDAQDRANAQLVAAKAESEHIRTGAYKEGYEQGLRDAVGMEEEKQQAIVAQFQNITQALEQREAARDDCMEKNILQLSIEVAEKIINVLVEKNDIVFMGMVKDAVKRLNAKEKFTIHLNEREYDRFFAQDSGWLADVVQSVPFTAISDPDIQPGGLTLTGQGGRVDAGLDTQLSNIRKALLPGEDQNEQAI